MKMTWRWYGEGNDQIKLSDIKQIPGVEGIVWALHGKMPGEVWALDEIAKVQQQLKPYSFNMKVVESVNVSDDIKTAGLGRTSSILWGTVPRRCTMRPAAFTTIQKKWPIMSCPSLKSTI